MVKRLYDADIFRVCLSPYHHNRVTRWRETENLRIKFQSLIVRVQHERK